MIILKLLNTMWLLQLRRFSEEEQALCSASEYFNYINVGRLYIFDIIYIIYIQVFYISQFES